MSTKKEQEPADMRRAVTALSGLRDPTDSRYLLTYGDAMLVVQAIRDGQIPNIQARVDAPGTTYPRKDDCDNQAQRF